MRVEGEGFCYGGGKKGGGGIGGEGGERMWKGGKEI